MLTKKELNIFCIWLQVMFLIFAPNLSYAVPKDQDRAILEGTETNLLTNPGFEARKSGWTASGSSTLGIETASPIKGKYSAKWNPSTTGEFLDSELIQIESGFVGDRCQMEFKYRWASGVTGEIKAVLRQFDDSEATEIDAASVDLTPTSGDLNSIVQLPMIDCPDDPADSYRFRLESTANAAEITLDKSFLGVGRNTFQLSQTILIAHAFYIPTTSCTWTSTSASYADFATVAACPAITVTSSTIAVDTSDNNLPDIDFDFLPAGNYVVIAEFTGQNSSAGVDTAYRISDGTTAESEAFLNVSAGNTSPITMHSNFVYSTGGARNFKMQIKMAGGTSSILNSADGLSLKWQVIKYPTTSFEAITFETVGEHWNVTIGGSFTDLSTSTVSSYIEMTDADISMTILPGSKSAKIPCASGTASEGLTCNGAAVNESVGIVIETNTGGRFKVCNEFHHAAAVDASGELQVDFQIMETTDLSSVIVTRGASIAGSACDDGNTLVANGCQNPIRTCAQFIFSTAGEKVFRLEYVQNAVATVTANRISTNAGNDSEDSMKWTVDKLDQQMPIPVLPDLTNSLNAKLESADPDGFPRLYTSVVVSYTAGVPTIVTNSNENVVSLVDTDTGTVTANFTNAYTSQPSIKCLCTVGLTAIGQLKCSVVHLTIAIGSVITEVRSTATGSLTDPNGDRVQIICIGK